MEVCKELKILSKEFHKFKKPLYIVGGFVRDNILNFPSTDIDITSALEESKVVEICKKLNIKYKVINKNLGTIQIRFNNFEFEYTRFRKESYKSDGSHTPNNISFINSLEEDSLRRDFTINSIYYDIHNNKIIDPQCGIKDIKKQIIKTNNIPLVTFSDDALRILRAIRFSSTLNFKIERKTNIALTRCIPKLANISKERILKELEQIVIADKIKDRANFNFLTFCNKTNILKYIFNYSMSRIKKFTKKDMQSFYSLDTNSRKIGFYCLILKKYLNGYTNDNNLSFTTNMFLRTNGLKESNENTYITEKIYRVYQNLEFGIDTINATINYLTLSDAERNIVESLLSKIQKDTLSANIKYIKDKKLPLNVHELNIEPQDLLDNNIESKYISQILKTLYNQVYSMKVKNQKEDLIELAKQINKTFKELKEKL